MNGCVLLTDAYLLYCLGMSFFIIELYVLIWPIQLINNKYFSQLFIIELLILLRVQIYVKYQMYGIKSVALQVAYHYPFYEY